MALAGSLFAAELGDDAQPLQVWKWIKGKKAKMAKGKGEKVYILEFWNTEHDHNRLCVPFLTGVQKKFKDEGVVVIAITNEKPTVVKRYIEKMGEQLEYVVAIAKTHKMDPEDVIGLLHAVWDEVPDDEPVRIR